MISISNVNFEKEKKLKNKEYIGKYIKIDINNIDCVFLFWKFMYIYKYKMRERGVKKCEIIWNDVRIKNLVFGMYCKIMKI